MKATIEIPDELYRLVKAKSALEGRAVREVTVDLYRTYVEQSLSLEPAPPSAEATRLLGGEALPPWFGVLGKGVPSTVRHDLAAIRDSIARGVAKERKL